MINFRAAAIQMTSSKEVDKNLKTAAMLIESAAMEGANIAILPEMFSLIGATETEKIGIGEPLGQGKLQDFLANQAIKHHIWLVGGTIPLLHPQQKKLLAASFVYNPKGEQVACYNKIHLFDAIVQDKEETYQESRITSPGNAIVIVDTPFVRLGLAVCYDIRFPELFRMLFKQGVEMFAIPAAFTATTGRAHWEILLRARAIENFSYVVGACQSGLHQGGRTTYGHSMIVNPWGEILACLPEGEGFIIADIDKEKLMKIRADMPVLSHTRINFQTDLPLVIG
jgi:deaminated glutathione amidase